MLGAVLAISTDTPLFDAANGARVPAGWVTTVLDVIVYSLVALVVMGAIAVITQLPFASRSNVQLPERKSRWPLILLLVALVVAANLIDRFRGDTSSNEERTAPVEAPRNGAVEREPEPASTPIRWTIVGGAAAISSAGLLLAMLVHRRARSGTPADDEPAEDHFETDEQRSQIAGRLAAGIAELVDLDGDPRRAILTAHQRLESILAEHGIVRPDSETSTEYLGRVLAALTARAGANRSDHPSGANAGATRLTELVELALYSTRPLGPADRDDAAAALRAVRDELRSVHVGA